MLRIHTLTHIYYLFIIHSFSIFFALIGSEKPSSIHFPAEIIQCILAKALVSPIDTYSTSYCKKNDCIERLYIPYTFIPTKLTKTSITLYSSPHETGLGFNMSYFFDSQLATKVEKNDILRIRLCNHETKEQHFSFIYGTSRIHFFDGINKNGTTVIARNDLGRYFYLYSFNVHDNNELDINTRPKLTSHLHIRDSLQQEHIQSLMLHPEKDTIAFTTTRIEDNPLYEETPHRLTIANIFNNSLTNIASINLPYLIDIKKMVYLGKKTYLALTYHHQLVIVWQEEDGTIKFCKQTHSSLFVDIAVDNTVENKNGFKPHVACLTNKNMLFVCSLLAFSQPILFFIKEIETVKNNASYFFRLFTANTIFYKRNRNGQK